MTDKTLNARMVQKHDIEAHWKLAENFVPKLGEVIVYDPDENCSYSRIKVGDGVTLVNSLPFSTPTAENIETALGYVPAKMPKYEQPDWGAEYGTATLYDGQLAFDDLVEGVMWYLSGFELIDGKTYTVNIDGNTWERTTAKIEDSGILYIGNLALAGVEEGSDEPFLLAYSPAENVAMLVVQRNDTDSNDYINFTLTTEEDTYYKIPSEYIEGIDEKIIITVSDFTNGAAAIASTPFEKAWAKSAEELARSIEVVKDGTVVAASVRVLKRDYEYDSNYNMIYIILDKVEISIRDRLDLSSVVLTWVIDN